MNRDIKFRAWNKFSKSMYENVGCMNGLIFRNLDFTSDQHIIIDSNFQLDGNVIDIMQNTGLKDKNGKEIYEKDIVKVTIEDKIFNAWIVFEMGSFMIANNDMSLYFEDSWNDTVKGLNELAWSQEDFEDRIYCLEVIGDIYQNRDLIEV